MDAIVGGIVGKLIKPVTDLISEVVTDKDKANELAYKVTTLAATQAHTEAMGQLEVNKQEAAHKSIFVAGWRPSIGWTCSVAIAIQFVLSPLSEPLGVSIPKLDVTVLWPLVTAMLGMATVRTAEKIRGVAREK